MRLPQFPLPTSEGHYLALIAAVITPGSGDDPISNQSAGPAGDAILQENGDFILQENGDFILQEVA